MRPNCWSRKTRPQQNDTRGKYYTFINEPGFYELVFNSKLEVAKRFRQWVFSISVNMANINYFISPWNKMIMIGKETDLHYKVADLIKRY